MKENFMILNLFQGEKSMNECYLLAYVQVYVIDTKVYEIFIIMPRNIL